MAYLRMRKRIAINNGFDVKNGYRTLELINSWINNVDLKISFLLAFEAVLLGAVLTTAAHPTRESTSCIATFLENPLICEFSLASFMRLATYIAFLKSIIFLFCALRGRVKEKESIQESSLIFFGAIARRSWDEYQEDIRKTNPDKLQEDLVNQIYVNSCICNKKFKQYNKGLCCLKIATVLCVGARLCGIL